MRRGEVPEATVEALGGADHPAMVADHLVRAQLEEQAELVGGVRAKEHRHDVTFLVDHLERHMTLSVKDLLDLLEVDRDRVGRLASFDAGRLASEDHVLLTFEKLSDRLQEPPVDELEPAELREQLLNRLLLKKPLVLPANAHWMIGHENLLLVCTADFCRD